LGKWLPYVIYGANHKNQGANGAIPELNASTVSVGVRLSRFWAASRSRPSMTLSLIAYMCDSPDLAGMWK
jgi:hypothetical protein